MTAEAPPSVPAGPPLWRRIVRRLVPTDREGVLAWLLVTFAVAFNAWYLYPEVGIDVPKLHDGVLHVLSLRRMVTALHAGQDPTDPWFAPVTTGYPLFHYYQHLPFLPPALFAAVFRGVGVETVYNWTSYLLLSAFPLSIYWSMRRFGFSPIAGALSALVAPLLATKGLFGFDDESYVWLGYGMYTQLWGMVLLPPALAQGYRTLRDGGGYFWSVLLVAAVVLSHLVLGYIALVSLVLFALLRPSPAEVWRRGKRLALVLALAGIVTSYFIVPVLLDNAYLNRSVFEEQSKYDAFGYEWTLRALFGGRIFDHGRFPSLTLLAGAGALLCAWRWRDERYRIPAAFGGLWLLMYFGRPTWGVLIDLATLNVNFYLHRLIAGVHLGGIMLMGLGLTMPWRWALARKRVWYLLAPVAITALVLFPVYSDRRDYLESNAAFMHSGERAYQREQRDLDALTAALRGQPPGRVYAGLAGRWGKDYRVGDAPMSALLNSAGFDMIGYLYFPFSVNSDIQALFDETRPEQYDLFNIRYVVAPKTRTFPDFVQPIGDFGRHRLYRVETSGYFGLVNSSVAFRGDRNSFYRAASKWLASGLPGKGQHPQILFEGDGGPGVYPQPLPNSPAVLANMPFGESAPRGAITSERVYNNSYVANVSVARSSFLMLKETYHPGWHAYVNGREAKTVMLMPSYLGVKLAPGRHVVRMVYRPERYRRLLLALGLLMLPAIGVAELAGPRLARAARRRNLRWPPPAARGPAMRASSLISGFSERVRSAVRARGALLSRLAPLSFVVLIAFLLGLPLLRLELIPGHDAHHHLPRITEMYEGLRSGQLFPRWAPDLDAGYGQPTFNYYPPLFYYVAAFFHALGFGIVAADDLALFAILIAAGLSMYLLASEFFGARGGLVSSAAYLSNSWLLQTVYNRHAVGDFASFAFMPLVFWSLYLFIESGKRRFMLTACVALALLMLATNNITLIALPFFILFIACLALWKRSPLSFLRGAACITAGLGIAAFFWLPALAERDFVHLAWSGIDYHLYFRDADWFIEQERHRGFPIARVNLLMIAAGIAITAVTALRPGRTSWASVRQAQLFFIAMILISVFFANDHSEVFWDRLPLLSEIQFPWRFHTLIALGGAFLCGLPLALFRTRPGWFANGLTVLLVGAVAIPGFSHARGTRSLAADTVDYSRMGIAAGKFEYTADRILVPIWVRTEPATQAKSRLEFVAGTGRIDSQHISPNGSSFAVDVTGAARLRLNTFYFPGWVLRVDGKERAIDHDNPEGVMEFTLGPGRHTVQAEFGSTRVRTLATGLSFATLFLLLLALLAGPRLARAARWRRPYPTVAPRPRDRG